MSYIIESIDPRHKDAARLLDELSEILKEITGASGRASFNSDDIDHEKAEFLLARDKKGEPIGCGGFRPIDKTTAEIKRMYSKVPGLGKMILLDLENRAALLGFSRLILETRKINQKAVSFYLANGYFIIENFGKYKDRPEAVCFEKRLRK